MPSVHEVIWGTWAAFAEANIFPIIMIGAVTVSLLLTPTLTSCVGSGTSEGTACPSFSVEAGPSGTSCDECMS